MTAAHVLKQCPTFAEQVQLFWLTSAPSAGRQIFEDVSSLMMVAAFLTCVQVDS